VSRAKILGTHRFVGWVVCNQCGRKWYERECDRAEIRDHVGKCQPDLAVAQVNLP
jgi:hypothetical protein